jgi:hypothetical protein
MSELDANTGPTPNDMPGAKLDTVEGADNNQLLEDGDEPAYEDLLAERDKWKKQAKTNENRAKANAEKAKAYDAEYEKFKAAYDREQQRRQQEKSPEQLKAEAEAAAEQRIADAESARAEAEAKLLRMKLSDGLPEWAMQLVTGQTEEEVSEQVAVVKGQLAEYVAAQIGEPTGPRRPAPNPLAGRAGQIGTSPQEQFASVFSKILN